MVLENASPQVVQLIAPWFDEAASILCTSLLRQQRIVNTLIGLKPGIVIGLQGIGLQPDGFLSRQFHLQSRHRVLILPFGTECMALALTEPRLHQLAKVTLQAKGFIAVPQDTLNLVQETGLFTHQNQHHFIHQEGDLRPFVHEISACVNQ